VQPKWFWSTWLALWAACASVAPSALRSGAFWYQHNMVRLRQERLQLEAGNAY
jgi:hypothetical protein